MHSWFRHGRAAIAVTFLVACAEQRPPSRLADSAPLPKQAETAPATIVLAPGVATQLAFAFAPSESDGIGRRASQQLLGSLIGAGFRFAPAGSSDADARFEVRVAPDEDSARPKVSLVLVHGDDVLEWATAVVTDESRLDDALRPLVARMCGSARVALFAQAAIQEKELSAARPRTTPKLAPDTQAVSSDASDLPLTDVALRRCRNARSIDSCQPVLAYLRDHPDGPRATQAQAALSLASARLQRIGAAAAATE